MRLLALFAGRILEYTLCGDPHGEAILHIHGFGGSALQVAQVRIKHLGEGSFPLDSCNVRFVCHAAVDVRGVPSSPPISSLRRFPALDSLTPTPSAARAVSASGQTRCASCSRGRGLTTSSLPALRSGACTRPASPLRSPSVCWASRSSRPHRPPSLIDRSARSWRRLQR